MICEKVSKTSYNLQFHNIQSSRHFLDFGGLAVVFNLKELPIGVTQTIAFFAWTN